MKSINSEDRNNYNRGVYSSTDLVKKGGAQSSTLLPSVQIPRDVETSTKKQESNAENGQVVRFNMAKFEKSIKLKDSMSSQSLILHKPGVPYMNNGAPVL